MPFKQVAALREKVAAKLNRPASSIKLMTCGRTLGDAEQVKSTSGGRNLQSVSY